MRPVKKTKRDRAISYPVRLVSEVPVFTREEILLFRCRCLETGFTVSRWARDAGIRQGVINNALTGRRNGPKSIAIRERVRREFSI